MQLYGVTMGIKLAIVFQSYGVWVEDFLLVVGGLRYDGIRSVWKSPI